MPPKIEPKISDSSTLFRHHYLTVRFSVKKDIIYVGSANITLPNTYPNRNYSGCFSLEI
ncbi:MAG: hypothetical protein Phog2KO_47640 [Phototrophicaceae bacterium]